MHNVSAHFAAVQTRHGRPWAPVPGATPCLNAD